MMKQIIIERWQDNKNLFKKNVKTCLKRMSNDASFQSSQSHTIAKFKMSESALHQHVDVSEKSWGQQCVLQLDFWGED